MSGEDVYWPTAGEGWERVDPASAGFDASRLAAAVDFARENETPWGRDLMQVVGLTASEPPPWNEIIGPVRERGGPNGLVLRGGRIVTEWGDTNRPDMTFSVAKSYVSTCAGLAWDDGLIPDLDAPVRDLVGDGGFDTPHNARITWRHLLQQTSEWEGTLWDKPDLVDRNRDVGRDGTSSRKGTHRDLAPPGTYWEYNDVRVNRLSLCVLRMLRRSLPETLKARIMDPIGASGDWEWHGYRNSAVTIDGREIVSVSGGGHWGGGLFIGSRDHARFGLLFQRGGRWDGRQLISPAWIDEATAPCPVNPEYGFMWWLNTGRSRFPSAPESSFFALGAGYNVIWIDPKLDLVAVVRWIDKAAVDGFCARVMAAIAEA